MNLGLSVLIFAYNEEKFIELTVKKILKSLLLSRISFEIIILNDSSTDKTKYIIQNSFKNNSNIKIYNFKKNVGLSKLLQFGVTKARFNKLTWFPGDDSYLEKNLKNFFLKSNNYNVVIGYRNNLYNLPKLRRFLSFVNRLFINILIGIKTKDVHGLLIAKVKDFKKIKFISSRYSFTVEVFPSIINKNTMYCEVPVFINKKTIKNSKTLSINTLKDFILSWFKVLLRVKIFNSI